MPAPAVTAPVPAAAAPAAEREIPKARPISPVARIAATDAAMLAELAIPKPGGAPSSSSAPAALEEGDLPPQDPNSIVLEPKRKTWIVIRNSAGGQKLYEDFLYPTAKPMRLPAGRYFIEIKEPDAVEISRNGKRIAYGPPGVAIE
jgi:hypothetical protein